MASIGAVGGTVQNLALYLSLDRKLPQAAGRRHAVARPDRQSHRPARHGLAGRPLAAQVRDAAHLPDRRARRSRRSSTRRRRRRSASAALLFGIGLGGDYMIIPLMAADLYGLAVMGRVMGVVLTADSVAEALVPMLVAAIRDRDGQLRGRVPGAGDAGGDRRGGGEPAAANGGGSRGADRGDGAGRPSSGTCIIFTSNAKSFDFP